MDKVTLRWAQSSLLLFIFLLGWMKHPLMIGGLQAFPSDFVYLISGSLLLLALLASAARLEFDCGFWVLALYFAAMALSVVESPDLGKSAFKLLTQVYLMSLPVLAFNLVRTARDLKRAFAAWVAAAGLIGLIGTAAVILLPIAGSDTFLGWTYHGFGTLPPGHYRRLELTYLMPAALANFLGVGMMLVLVAKRVGWVGAKPAITLTVAIGIATFFTLTPGIGGVLFAVLAWAWYCNREERPRLAAASLAVAVAMPILATLAATVSPVMPRNSPFMIDIPGLPAMAPSVRLLAWTQAIDKTLTSPVLGHGIGIDPVDVDYEAAGCGAHCVFDAHNAYLNIAAECGLVGLAGLLAVIAFVILTLVRAVRTGSDLTAGLSIAWLGGFAAQGLVGEFEDMRHLWLLFGLILSARRIFDSDSVGDEAARERLT